MKKKQKPKHIHHHKRITLRTLLEDFMALSQTVVAALDAEDQKIADLSQKVDAFIASHQSNSAADDQAVVDRVTAQGAAVDAISAKLV
jgi:hypothetical protein